jgi:hypothetical protein
MEITQITQKGRHMNSLEIFHIYCAHQQNKQMNEVLFDLQNPIFHTIYNHYTKHTKNPHHSSRQLHRIHHHVKNTQAHQSHTAIREGITLFKQGKKNTQ